MQDQSNNDIDTYNTGGSVTNATYKYKESRSNLIAKTSETKRVSTVTHNATSEKVIRSLNYSSSSKEAFGVNISGDLSPKEKIAIKGGVSFNWENSASVSDILCYDNRTWKIWMV